MHNINFKKIKPNTKLIAQKIVYFKSVSSTNTLAKETECENGTLFIAESQTNGKGRMGRQWVSEENSGIYMSIVLFPEIPAGQINQLTLLAGLSVCKVLIELYGVDFKIKWPNDIVAYGKKICGILTEGVISNNRSKAVVGIGINVNNKKFDDELSHKATSLYMLTGKPSRREIIINKIAETFEKNYNDFLNGKSFIKEYENLCVNINHTISAIVESNAITGVAVGITDKGELMVKKEDGTTLNINSGEVSVRGIYGYY